MENGRRDPDLGRFSSPAPILNTRAVFRHIAEHGKFGDPHAIGDWEVHERGIDWVHFHCPVPNVVAEPSTDGSSAPTVRNFRANSERLCVIRHK
jgi:hypothetical protein